MSLDKLRELSREADTIEALYRKEASAAQRLKDVRNHSKGWAEIWNAMTSHYNGRNERALEALTGVLDEMSHDILRIAELRLAASEREYKVKAAQRRAVLSACILPLPEGASHD